MISSFEGASGIPISRLLAQRTAANESPAPAPPSPAKLSFFDDAFARDPSDETHLAEVIELVRAGRWSDDVTALRAALAAEGKEKYDKAKRKLPAVMLSGWVVSRNEEAPPEDREVRHSGLLQGDFDGKDHPHLSLGEIMDLVRADPHVVAAFVSPSGQGVKAVLSIPPDAKCHREAFEAAAEHFEQFGLKLDPATKDPGRLCFVSHDPDAWIRPVSATIKPKKKVKSKASTDPGFFDQLETTAADIREMLSFIPPRPEYHDWLRIASAVWSELDEATGTALLAEWSPEEKPGEYARKYKKRLADVKCGTLVWYAQANGFDAAAAARRKRWCGKIKFVRELATAPVGKADECSDQEAPPPDAVAPDRIFYDAPAGRYFVDTGTRYDAHAKPAPLLYGLGVHIASVNGSLSAKEVREMALSTLNARSLIYSVQWSGSIAGHRRGFVRHTDGQTILITDEPKLIEPRDGPFPTIATMLRQAFPDPVPLQIFVGWLAGRRRAVHAGVHLPGPALVLAAGVNKGKSLLAKEVIAPCLGDRIASPLKAWSGLTIWNDDLLKAELLLVDDEVATTDIRSRRNFGASLKTAMFAPSVAINRRNSTSVHVRPAWSVVICCNDTPEALQIIPPLDADLSDKVILLRPETITPPVDTSTPAGRLQFQAMIREDLPQFASFLESFTLPEELQDSRSGVKAYRDPHLLQNVGATSPEHQLEELLVATAKAGWLNNLASIVSAADLQLHLLDPKSPVRDQAKSLLSWPQACGAYLARLADNGSEVVRDGGKDGHRKIRLYEIKA